MDMELYIAADHNGFELKNELKSWLQEKGLQVIDMGPESFEKDDDYPDYGYKVATQVAEKPNERKGLLLCGSGVGMAVTANKVPGIRAALIHDVDIAKSAQRDDDINVLALGASYIAPNRAKAVIEAWLNTPFSPQERYVRRIEKISDYEKKHAAR